MTTNDTRAEKSAGPGTDLSAFNEIVVAMNRLDNDARLRLFRTLATFFDIPHNEKRQIGGDTTIIHGSPIIQSGRQSAPTFSEDRSVSPKQFLFDKKPLTDIDRIVCLAYYLTHYRDTPHFKTLDLSKLNTEAAQIKFSNPTVAMDNAAQGGLLVQAGKGQKQLSALGEVYVEALPDRAAAKEAIAHARPRKSRSRHRQKSAKVV